MFRLLMRRPRPRLIPELLTVVHPFQIRSAGTANRNNYKLKKIAQNRNVWLWSMLFLHLLKKLVFRTESNIGNAGFNKALSNCSHFCMLMGSRVEIVRFRNEFLSKFVTHSMRLAIL